MGLPPGTQPSCAGYVEAKDTRDPRGALLVLLIERYGGLSGGAGGGGLDAHTTNGALGVTRRTWLIHSRDVAAGARGERNLRREHPQRKRGAADHADHASEPQVPHVRTPRAHPSRRLDAGKNVIAFEGRLGLGGKGAHGLRVRIRKCVGPARGCGKVTKVGKSLAES